MPENPRENSLRAGVYLRISQDRTGQQAGVTRQEEDCRELCASNGWVVAEAYVDNDTSATSGKVRPAYRQMLADIAAGRLDVIVAWHTDRLYRRLADLEELIPACEHNHVTVRTVKAGEIDLSTPTGRMLARILGSVAGHEVEQKADRWRRSYVQKRAAGEVYRSGPRHFGYERDGSIVEAEAEALRKMANLVLQGASIPSVCRAMNAEEIRTTLGNRWRPVSVRALLKSPRLAGLVLSQGKVLDAVEAKWKPIFDRATWEMLQLRLAPTHDWSGGPRKAVLSGLVYCGREGCGKRMYSSARVKGVRVYRCTKWPDEGCGRISVVAEPVEEIVEAYARRLIDSPAFRHALAVRSGTGQAAGVVRRIDELEFQLADLQSALRDTSKSAADVVRAMDDLREQIAQERAKLESVAPDRLPQVGEWPDDVERRAALIGLAVGRVWIDPDTSLGRGFRRERVRIDPADR